MKTALIPTLLAATLSLGGYAQAWNLTDHLSLGPEGTSSMYYNRSVVTAPDGGCYVVGLFSDSLIIGQDTLRTEATRAVYCARLDSDLNPLWTKRIAENYVTVGGYTMWCSTASDASGNLIVAASYTDELHFFGNESGASGTVGIELLKLNSQGDTIWTAEVEGEHAGVRGIALNAEEEILLTGMDAGEVFLSKFTGQGDLIWRRTAGVAGGADRAYAISTDPQSNVYIIGYLDSPGIAHFDNLSVSLPGTAYIASFLAKYDTEGSVQWVRYVYCNIWGEVSAFVGLTCTATGDVVLAGTYADSMLRFSNGYPAVGPQFGGEAQWFLTAFSPDGERLWVTVPPYWEQGESFARDIQLWDSNILMLSEFTGNAWSANGNLSSYGSKDMRLQVFDTVGSMVSDLQMGGTSLDLAGNLLVSGSDLFLVGATVSHPFNVGADSFDHPDPGNAFVIKLAQDPNGLPSVAANQLFSAYPNPSNGEVQLSLDPRLGRCRVVVRDAMGRVVLERSVSGPTETMRIPESGLYLLELMGTDGRLEAQRLIVE